MRVIINPTYLQPSSPVPNKDNIGIDKGLSGAYLGLILGGGSGRLKGFTDAGMQAWRRPMIRWPILYAGNKGWPPHSPLPESRRLLGCGKCDRSCSSAMPSNSPSLTHPGASWPEPLPTTNPVCFHRRGGSDPCHHNHVVLREAWMRSSWPLRALACWRSWLVRKTVLTVLVFTSLNSNPTSADKWGATCCACQLMAPNAVWRRDFSHGVVGSFGSLQRQSRPPERARNLRRAAGFERHIGRNPQCPSHPTQNVCGSD